MNLSIIIPVYNCENYIERCVESILSQGLVDYEIILIDDGSTDNSGTICEQLALKTSFIRLYHKANGGAGSARNLGISNASGEYIWFIDADDFLEPNSVAKLFNLIETNKLDILQIGYSFVYADMSRICFRKVVNSEVLTPQNYMKKGLFNGSACQFIFSKSLLAENITFDEEIEIGQDGIFFIQLFVRASRVQRVDYRGYYYFQNQSSTTHNFSFLGPLKVVSKIDRLTLPEYTNEYISTFKSFYLSLVFLSKDFDESSLHHFLAKNSLIIDISFIKKLFQQLLSYRYGFLRLKTSKDVRFGTLIRIEKFFENYKHIGVSSYVVFLLFRLTNIRVIDFLLYHITIVLKFVYFRKI